MSDIARFGLPIAVLIAAAVTCLFLLIAPTAHTPSTDRITGHVRVNPVIATPYTPDTAKEATTNA